MTKGLYIAGAGKDAGKTTLCLGLLHGLQKLHSSGTAFTKPLGQKTTLIEGRQVGQDSWFVDKALGMNLPLEKAAPFAASSGAAARYIREGFPRDLPARVRRAYHALGSRGRLVMVEGTGHPGVGSVFDMSNARVAKILKTPVLLVLDGGVGSTIDRFNLCASMFNHYDVPVLGVVFNRVIPGKMQAVKELLGEWFSRRNIPVFGYIPYEESIARPSAGLIRRTIGAEPVVEKAGASVSTGGYISAFGSAETVLKQISLDPGKTLLVDVSRPDVLDAVIVSGIAGGGVPGAVIVCGGEPDSRRREAFARADIPLYATGRGIEASTGRLSRRIFKVEPHEEDKIRKIIQLVEEHVDIEAVLQKLSGEGEEKRPGGIRGFFGRLFSGKKEPE